MPFCRECGNQVDGAMKFCSNCAAPQEVSRSQPPPAAIVQPEPEPAPVMDSGLVEASTDILNRCVVFVEEDETRFSVKFTWPGSAHPALKAALNTMSGNIREGRALTDFVDLSTFGSYTQAHLWKLWNEAKGHWSQFARDESSRVASSSISTPPAQNEGEIWQEENKARGSPGTVIWDILLMFPKTALIGGLILFMTVVRV